MNRLLLNIEHQLSVIEPDNLHPTPLQLPEQ
jgi:hypothetical protein